MEHTLYRYYLYLYLYLYIYNHIYMYMLYLPTDTRFGYIFSSSWFEGMPVTSSGEQKGYIQTYGDATSSKKYVSGDPLLSKAQRILEITFPTGTPGITLISKWHLHPLGMQFRVLLELQHVLPHQMHLLGGQSPLLSSSIFLGCSTIFNPSASHMSEGEMPVLIEKLPRC